MPDQIRTDQQLTVTPNLVQVIAANPHIPITVGGLLGIARGETILHEGCITNLYYNSDGDDLHYVQLDSGAFISATNVSNLKDFRDRLQEAANFGHKVVICEDKSAKVLRMLHVRPCQCTCDKRN